ncbi:hypothetical protein A6V39_01800 [Candidatus Mycoplasma haematobovis]|uniref:Uncharacterized protein n=1 Tax=Candidatus Mycoplasma haematobovis TaxID=432608 RepID=A0A1A9QE71_9MOLU|nr:hypothetical protein [Candidatus Mycoplasma haematobovis]OAL10777.1 hypothetical protein A6V39_01800 [Candidatus Mycoplasma haematobovis]
MKKIAEVFQKKDEINSFEEKLLWREELLYLLQKKKSSDTLLKEIVDNLNLPASKERINDSDSELINKFDIFFKYLNKPKKTLHKQIIALVNQSEEYLNDNSKFSTLNNDLFYSDELSNWANELYYLIQKSVKKDDFIQNILELLKKAKIVLIGKDKLELENHLRMFKIVKHRYIDTKE